jgi:3-dehydroquinate synthase
LIAQECDRHTLIVAVGGGAVGDVAGFVAATYLRGIRWIGVPTTVMAQVDSSIGGKTAVNHGAAKNLIGAFHQPTAVFCDLQWFKTLPVRELSSGLAEACKYALLYDRKMFKNFEKNLERLLAGESQLLEDCVRSSIRHKARAIFQDEHDLKGLREKLNFGHTFGHAIEQIFGYGKLRHGEAVLWGMRLACHLSVARGHMKLKDNQRIQSLLERWPVARLKEIRWLPLAKALHRDKKVRRGHLRFVLLKRVGHSIVDESVTMSDIQKAMTDLGLLWR